MLHDPFRLVQERRSMFSSYVSVSQAATIV
jgi:hypothetical protein